MLTGGFYKRDLENIIEAFDKRATKKDRLDYDDWRRLQRFVNEMLLFDRPGTVEVDEGPVAGSYLLTLAYNHSPHGQYSVEIKINDCFYAILKENIDLWDNSIAKYIIKNIDSITVNNHTIDDITACGIGPLGVDYATTTSINGPPEYSTATATSTSIYKGTTTTVGETIKDILTERVDDLEMKVKDAYVNDKKENNNMELIKGFEFGKLTNPNVRLSMYGLAIKNSSGTWVSYDTNSGDIIDVDVFNFNSDSFLYQMPVGVKNIKVGDLVVHNRKPCFVVNFSEYTGNPIVIDIINAERKEILPVKNCFGFNFITRIINLLDGMLGDMKPSADNPFGSMLPFLMMSDNAKMDDILPMMLMMNGNIMDNPMLMYAMMKGDNKDMLPFLMMMNQDQKCSCAGKED